MWPPPDGTGGSCGGFALLIEMQGVDFQSRSVVTLLAADGCWKSAVTTPRAVSSQHRVGVYTATWKEGRLGVAARLLAVCSWYEAIFVLPDDRTRGQEQRS